MTLLDDFMTELAQLKAENERLRRENVRMQTSVFKLVPACDRLFDGLFDAIIGASQQVKRDAVYLQWTLESVKKVELSKIPHVLINEDAK